MKNHIVIYISPEIPYLVKFWFLSYVPKSANQILGSLISPERSEV